MVMIHKSALAVLLLAASVALAAAGPTALRATMSGETARGVRRVVINTDPGIDDSMAMLLALGSPEEIEVLAITVNFGSLHNTTTLALNARRVLELAGRPEIPVFVGAADPVGAEFHDLGGPGFHGEDGLGNTDQPLPKEGPRTDMSAQEYLVRVVREHPGRQVDILSFAPVTNLAMALRLDPTWADNVGRIYMMGGTVGAAGNVSPVVEANFGNDAHAARLLFASGAPITVAGLDVTMATRMTPQYIGRLGSLNAAGRFIAEITKLYFAAYKHIGFPFMPVHDPSAVMALIAPHVYTGQHLPAEIKATAFGDPVNGMVVADRRGGPDSPPHPDQAALPFFLLTVDTEEFLRVFAERIQRL